jgi:hypothetical protein
MSKYAEIKDKYPQDRGGYDENAKVVIEEYQSIGEWQREETIAEAENNAEIRKEWDRIADAIAVIADAVNGRNVKDVAKAMYIGVSRNHRTLQNQAVAAMFEFLRIYKDTAYDLRNWSAVVAAAQVSQMAEDEGIVFPFI